MISPLKIISIFVCVLLLIGFTKRKKRRTHIPFMLIAFAIDMGMVLYIELDRHAIEQAVGPISGIMKFHIAVSILVVVLYIVQIVTGVRKLKGLASTWHGRSGVTLLVLRLANLITSFMVTSSSAHDLAQVALAG